MSWRIVRTGRAIPCIWAIPCVREEEEKRTRFCSIKMNWTDIVIWLKVLRGTGKIKIKFNFLWWMEKQQSVNLKNTKTALLTDNLWFSACLFHSDTWETIRLQRSQHTATTTLLHLVNMDSEMILEEVHTLKLKILDVTFLLNIN